MNYLGWDIILHHSIVGLLFSNKETLPFASVTENIYFHCNKLLPMIVAYKLWVMPLVVCYFPFHLSIIYNTEIDGVNDIIFDTSKRKKKDSRVYFRGFCYKKTLLISNERLRTLFSRFWINSFPLISFLEKK